jgi:hypothetical protein
MTDAKKTAARFARGLFEEPLTPPPRFPQIAPLTPELGRTGNP